MFWGLIMEPQRRYTQQVKKAFHISMAALDISTSSDEPAQVMCGFEGRNYLLCTLKKPNQLQCPLDLSFDIGSEVSFAANGKCHVHLTGYLIEEQDLLVPEETEIEEEEEEEQEEEQEVNNIADKSKKRSKKDLKNGPPTKKLKNSKVSSSQNESQNSDSEDSDSENDIKALLEKSLDDSDDDSDEYAVEEESEDEELEEEEEDSSLSEEEDEDDENKKSPKSKMNGVPQKQELQKKKKDKKKEKQVEQNKKSKSEQKEIKTPNKETPRKKVIQGGVIIEDIREGQGAPAKNGKIVNVYYEGRLKQNNKVFDATNKGAGFSFRLGAGDVIKGWDVGVVGMKTGGKRRITCPANMAYGQKGSPPAIPPNSTLVFEVELKKCH